MREEYPEGGREESLEGGEGVHFWSECGRSTLLEGVWEEYIAGGSVGVVHCWRECGRSRQQDGLGWGEWVGNS